MSVMWYESGRVMRKQRQKANQSPRFVAASIKLPLAQYRLVERGELRLDGEILSHWCHLVALGHQPISKDGEIKLSPEQQHTAQLIFTAVKQAQKADHEARGSKR